MKNRTGFVSNSSTSSFCLWGIIIPDDVTEMFRERMIEEKDIGPEDWFDFGEWVQSLGFDYWSYTHSYGHDKLLGLHPTRIGDDETYLQFKTRIANNVNDLLKTNYQAKDVKFLSGTREG